MHCIIKDNILVLKKLHQASVRLVKSTDAIASMREKKTRRPRHLEQFTEKAGDEYQRLLHFPEQSTIEILAA